MFYSIKICENTQKKKHKPEAQSSRGTKGKRDEKQIRTSQMPHINRRRTNKEELKQRINSGTVSKRNANGVGAA